MFTNIKSQGQTNVGKTIVWVVRHAEMDSKIVNNPNPNLSKEGKRRSAALADYFKMIRIDGIFTTSSTVTQKTAEHLFVKYKSLPILYDGKDLPSLVNKITNEYKGKTVLVVTNLTNMLALVDAFGADRPIPKLRENDYNFLFKINILPNDDVYTEMDQYEAGHHDGEE